LDFNLSLESSGSVLSCEFGRVGTGGVSHFEADSLLLLLETVNCFDHLEVLLEPMLA